MIIISYFDYRFFAHVDLVFFSRTGKVVGIRHSSVLSL